MNTKDVDEWYEEVREVLKDGPTINFNAIPDDSDLVINSIRYPPHTGRNLPADLMLFTPQGLGTTAPTESKMEDVKTETYKGQVYQIGLDYLFSDQEGGWVYDKLTGIVCNNPHPFCTASNVWLCIKEVPAPEGVGTITPAPIEFEHGKAYTFDYGDVKNFIGIYEHGINAFVDLETFFIAADCKNIRPMKAFEDKK